MENKELGIGECGLGNRKWERENTMRFALVGVSKPSSYKNHRSILPIGNVFFVFDKTLAK